MFKLGKWLWHGNVYLQSSSCSATISAVANNTTISCSPGNRYMPRNSLFNPMCTQCHYLCRGHCILIIFKNRLINGMYCLVCLSGQYCQWPPQKCPWNRQRQQWAHNLTLAMYFSQISKGHQTPPCLPDLAMNQSIFHRCL